MQEHLRIIIEKQGTKHNLKQSFPLRRGNYSQISTKDFEFCFNLNGEIKFIRGLGPHWPHPAEQLKRTIGNDWVYYSVGDKSGSDGIISWMGEYYLPCLPYPSNPVWEIDYHSMPRVMNGLAQWSQLYGNLFMADHENRYPHAKDLIKNILKNDDNKLFQRSKDLNSINRCRVSVLPPDSRHLDYELIPLIIADGCLYHCKFCCVKSEKKFKKRTKENIDIQINELSGFYGKDLKNQNGIFLGNHDALAAGEETLLYSAKNAFRGFGFKESENPQLHMFGSIASLLMMENSFLEKLNDLPFKTFINIGFESFHGKTLEKIGKPVGEKDVEKAFYKAVSINNNFSRIEITGNFIMGEDLALDHYELTASFLEKVKMEKGCFYLSPLQNSPKKRELLTKFKEIKERSSVPVFIYLIQRL